MLEEYIDNVIKGNDPFAMERERINMVINSYNDGDSCKRVEMKVFGGIR